MVQPQELANTLAIDEQGAAWDADLRLNFDRIAALLKSYSITNSAPGDTATPSRIHIQLQNSRGEDVSREAFLRVRAVDLGLYANATNATIAAAGGTTVVETISATKDLVFKSDGTGLFEIDAADAVAETFELRIGPAPLSPDFGTFRNGIEITHA